MSFLRPLRRMVAVPLIMMALSLPTELAAETEDGAVMKPADALEWVTPNRIPFSYVWGDAKRGAHGEFVRFPAGFVSPVHHHSNAYHGVVIDGVLMNPMGRAESATRLPAGSYYFVPGGAVHTTRCVSEQDCLIYLHQDGPFDFVPTDQ